MLTTSTIDHRRTAPLTLLLFLLAALILAGCSSPETTATAAPTTEQPAAQESEPTEADPPLPEELEFEIAVQRPPQGAADSPEDTWEAFLRDSIALNVARVQDRLLLFESYQNPIHLEQNIGGLLADVDLVEDRTVFDTSNQDTFATATADFDVRITYADGDTERRACQFAVQIEQDPEDKLWYIINPQVFSADSMCVSN